jgi:hypothetical protein
MDGWIGLDIWMDVWMVGAAVHLVNIPVDLLPHCGYISSSVPYMMFHPYCQVSLTNSEGMCCGRKTR